MADMFGQRFDSAQLHTEKDKYIENQLLILLFFIGVAKKVAKRLLFMATKRAT